MKKKNQQMWVGSVQQVLEITLNNKWILATSYSNKSLKFHSRFLSAVFHCKKYCNDTI